MIFGVGQVGSWTVSARRLRGAQLPSRTLTVGAAGAVVGFFALPVVGFVLGFIAGIYLLEFVRLGDSTKAWHSARHALAAAGWGMLMETGAAILLLLTWITASLLA